MSLGNNAWLSSWGNAPSGAAIPTTRTGFINNDPSNYVTRWMVQKTASGKWTLLNMWYPASEGYWYLSCKGGCLALETIPFEWDIQRDPAYENGFRIRVPGTSQLDVTSIGIFGDRFIRANVEIIVPRLGRDAFRWVIHEPSYWFNNE